MPIRWDLEPVVDLGEDFDVPTATPPPAVTWHRRPQVRAALLILLVLVLVAASMPTPTGPLRLAARIPIGIDASAMIEGPNLYIYDISDGHNGLRAYRLDGGELLWSAVTSELAPETTMQYVDDRIVVSMTDTDAGGEHTVAFDAQTGRRAWSSDFGYATIATGGVLVESAPRPPGFNYPGTVRSATFRLVDTPTGRTEWSVALPDECDTQVASTAGRASALVELCANSSQLSVIDLADGRTAASRSVFLGNPADNFVLPPPDQMEEPQLTVAGDTLLIAHANAPQPTIDAYAIADLNQLWSGLPVVEGQDVDQCGTALCVYDGASNGSVFDLHSGKEIGLIPPRTVPTPPSGMLELVPVGQPLTFSTGYVLQSIAHGQGTLLSEGRDQLSTVPAADAMWLASWHVTQSASGRQTVHTTPIQIIRGVDDLSCVQIVDYLACSTPHSSLTLWQVATR
ncbi:MAG TPA: PQQ-binding-like beta-propeller repeat protein [Micromonosporaceae bacterium]|jgi:hypothetical protein